jgi:hypothetical protein
MNKKGLFLCAMLIIPVDFVLWNLIMGVFHGFVSWNRCVADNMKRYRELSIQVPKKDT